MAHQHIIGRSVAACQLRRL